MLHISTSRTHSHQNLAPTLGKVGMTKRIYIFTSFKSNKLWEELRRQRTRETRISLVPQTQLEVRTLGTPRDTGSGVTEISLQVYRESLAGQRCMFVNLERESGRQHRHRGEGTPSLERQKKTRRGCGSVVFGQEENLAGPRTGKLKNMERASFWLKIGVFRDV